MLGIHKRVVRHRLPDILSRGRIKQRVVCVQYTLEPRTIDALELRNLLDLAIHERSVVAPSSVKQLVAFHTHRETLSDVFVVDQTIAKIENARATAARDDLLKWIPCVERTDGRANLRISRAAKWWCSDERLPWRDVERWGTRQLEIARGYWRKLIVRFGIYIVEVAKNPQLIIADLVFESRVTTPAFLLRIRAGIQIEVKPWKNAKRRPGTTAKINIIACWT